MFVLLVYVVMTCQVSTLDTGPCGFECGRPEVSNNNNNNDDDDNNNNNNIIIIIINNNNDNNSRFFTVSSLRREPSPTRTLKWPGRNRMQITCNTLSAYHVQHVVLRATWYERIAQLLSLTV